MDDPIASLFIFVVIVFLYIHIVAQWKKSEDLEIYETDYTNNTHLLEVCGVKQPVLFAFRHQTPIFDTFRFSAMDKYAAYSVNIKDIYDYWKPANNTLDAPVSIDPIELPFHSSRNLMKSDTTSRYISENNSAFLLETGLDRALSSMDSYLKQPIGLYSSGDIMFGSKHAVTPMRYHTSASYFIIPTSGKITLKMTPWKSREYLHPVKDYEYYEFWSRVNVWNPLGCHSNEMSKLRFLEFDVLPGHILFIPPYWWYSIRFSTDPETCVCALTYDTPINALAHSYDWGMYYLQQNNIHTRISSSNQIIASLDTIAPKVLVQVQGDEQLLHSNTTIDENDVSASKTENPPALPSNELSPDYIARKPPEKKEIVTNAGTYHT